jgi:hypothetical protein
MNKRTSDAETECLSEAESEYSSEHEDNLLSEIETIERQANAYTTGIQRKLNLAVIMKP